MRQVVREHGGLIVRSASLDESIDVSRKAEVLIECHSKQFYRVVVAYL